MTQRQFYDWQTAGGGGDIAMLVQSLDDTLHGKVLAWRDSRRRPSKRQKDLLEIMRLVEAHPELASRLPPDVAERLRGT